jgi:endonuclease-3 related protein
LGKRSFVVDAYTRRIFSRVGLIKDRTDYENIRNMFMKQLPPRVGLYNDYHAQLVALGKGICRKKPRCQACPITQLCDFNAKKFRAVENPLAY